MSATPAQAAAALARGQLVLMPTETVYGLAADAGRSEAVAAIFEAKSRPRFNPLIAHAADPDAAARIADLGALGARLAEAFWPGPLTLVAPARPAGGVCDLARAGLDSVAVRVPDHPLALEMLAAVGRPVVAPSANRSGRPSPTTLPHALAETGAAASVALDGGPCRVGLESTVVSLLGARPAILRPGGVTRTAVEAVVGPLQQPADDSHRSPGRLALHYAPDAPVRLEAQAAEPGEVLIGFGPHATEQAGLNLSPRGDLREAAANLFAYLREADSGRPRGIAVAPIPREGLGEAINDRLRRAAGYIG